ncbi:MAG: hypothetical protein H0T46_18020 [Deltaproteobacteria bacterium]|nr:hypothetical protein [Deltaproteobacteria bacterium]
MNIKSLVSSLVAVVGVVLLCVRPAAADARSDRAAIADALTKLATSAANLGKAAKASDDRGARKKFAPAATELGDDLTALAKRLGKDIPIKSIATDAAAIEKDAGALVELADEAEDKEERKSLRSQAVLIQQGIAAARKSIGGVKEDGGGAAPTAPQRFTGRIFNDTDGDRCGISENLKFAISRDGQQVYVSPNMVFPGKNFSLVLEKGTYLVQLLDTTSTFKGQRTLDATKEGWIFKSGCVNED